MADPRIEASLAAAGFSRDVIGRQAQPGMWWRSQIVDGQQIPIEVDLLVPETLTDGGRGAQIPPHDRAAIRRVPGIELAVEDHSIMTITSLEPMADDRSFELRVAGVPALLVAKSYKIRDRLLSAKTSRLSDKDASDVYRLATTADPAVVAAELRRLAESARVGETARLGVALVHEQFGTPRGSGVEMAVRALRGSVQEARVRAVLPAFARELPRF